MSCEDSVVSARKISLVLSKTITRRYVTTLRTRVFGITVCSVISTIKTMIRHFFNWIPSSLVGASMRLLMPCRRRCICSRKTPRRRLPRWKRVWRWIPTTVVCGASVLSSACRVRNGRRVRGISIRRYTCNPNRQSTISTMLWLVSTRTTCEARWPIMIWHSTSTRITSLHIITEVCCVHRWATTTVPSLTSTSC